ncbi:plasmid mobilization relaxosome protein MobC [Aeromonas caviae]
MRQLAGMSNNLNQIARAIRRQWPVRSVG